MLPYSLLCSDRKAPRTTVYGGSASLRFSTFKNQDTRIKHFQREKSRQCISGLYTLWSRPSAECSVDACRSLSPSLGNAAARSSTRGVGGGASGARAGRGGGGAGQRARRCRVESEVERAPRNVFASPYLIYSLEKDVVRRQFERVPDRQQRVRSKSCERRRTQAARAG